MKRQTIQKILKIECQIETGKEKYLKNAISRIGKFLAGKIDIYVFFTRNEEKKKTKTKTNKTFSESKVY